MAASASAKAALELAELEIEAKSTARKHVANMLQRPDQLERVEQIRKRASRKKASVEAMLKTAVQSQLDGVRTGMNQLHNALKDIQEVKESINEAEKTYNSISGLGEKLKRVQEENVRHSQLAAAVENLKHIFTVPETVKKCDEYINDGKLLHAHKCLTDLESCRDDLLYELHKHPNPSTNDRTMVDRYFEDVQKLSDDLSKQLWLILQRTLMTVRREPTIIVTVLRIIEREQRTDDMMMKRYDMSSFLPPNRPKRWRQKAFATLEEAVVARIEGNQMEDRSQDKMWLVRHLEVTRQLVLEDLRVIKTLCESTFPPHYDIVNKYLEMYHNGIGQHLKDVIDQGLEGNEFVSLLTWVHEYTSKEMMGNPELHLDISEFSPLLEQRELDELQNQYLKIMEKNFEEWMANSLKSDVKDWQRDQKPDSNNNLYHTQLPLILFQMIEQNLQVASTINDNLVYNAIHMCVDKLAFMVKYYRDEMIAYKERHLQDRSQPPFFLQYIMANINNCENFSGLVMTQIGSAYIKDPLVGKNDRFHIVAESFQELASELCDILLEEVFLDIDQHLQEMITRKWLNSRTAVDTVCFTVEDYFDDFLHMKQRYYLTLVKKAELRVAAEYIKSLFTRKITFKNYEERAPAADKMCLEAEQLGALFTRLNSKVPETTISSNRLFDVVPYLTEILKLQDTSMVTLEIAGLVNNYPDIKIDQLVNLLLMRGDVGRSDARMMVIDCLGEDHDLKSKSKSTIVSKLYS